MLKFPFPVVVAGVSIAALPMAVSAQSSDDEALDPIVVTATVGPETIGEGLSSVAEISEREIDKWQPLEFQDVLASQPGIAISGNGALGKQTTVFIRGHESDATVLLVNGIRIRSATTGSPAWQFLPPQLISRVEIVRGSSSSLYGSDAMGGVVQAFTMPESEGTRGWVETSAGNLDTQNYSAGFSSIDDHSALNVGVNRFRTEGAPVIEGGEDKPYDSNSGTFSASHEFTNGIRTNVTYLGAEGSAEYEGGYNDFVLQVAGVGVDVPVTENWRTSLKFSDARDVLDDYGAFPFEVTTKTRTSRIENWLTAGVHEFVVGAETMTDQVEASTNYVETSRANDALFGQALLTFGPSDLHLSARRDDNEAYGTHETWGVAYGYQFDSHHRIRLSSGTAFKAPTFNDLYYPFGFGNPDLAPEESISFEAGLEGNYQNWFWDAAIYHSEVDNLIVYDSQAGKPLNVEKARLKGMELLVGWQRDGWRTKAVASLGDFVNREDGSQLIRRPEQSIRVDVDKDFGRWYAGTSVRAESHRFDEVFSRIRIPGYAVWNVRAGISFDGGWQISASIDNVLDNEYALAQYDGSRNYISAGRTALLSVRYDFVR
ncbi:vitamin B12 transporter [Marinobacter pelagius]|uniref:Vitamin B12 transporter n=1 Tax=Marinobacter pelagius TaxID=379482 RepID=A0A366GVP0_9GAMM|nr:TonB-dependent receptor [Marinobacter pelagius]RBP32295.1 vitamin B12 transporter [Marinobacter pelagius]